MGKRKSSAQTPLWVAAKVVVVMNAGVACSSHAGGTTPFDISITPGILSILTIFFLPCSAKCGYPNGTKV